MISVQYNHSDLVVGIGPCRGIRCLHSISRSAKMDRPMKRYKRSNRHERHGRWWRFFGLTGGQWLILLMVQLSNLLFGMTITIANLVLPQIRGSFSATQDEISWVITLNLGATAVATPLTGWVSSRIGWRNIMFQRC